MRFSSFNPKGADIELSIYDLSNSESRRRGFSHMKDAQLQSNIAFLIPRLKVIH